jgi:hypothetical protein
VIIKSKKQWARPDRPGSWGQRRDLPIGGMVGIPNYESGNERDLTDTAAPQQQHHHLRRMKSESTIGRRDFPQKQQGHMHHAHQNGQGWKKYNSQHNLNQKQSQNRLTVSGNNGAPMTPISPDLDFPSSVQHHNWR